MHNLHSEKGFDNKYVLSQTLFPTCFSPAYSTWFFQNLHFSGTGKIYLTEQVKLEFLN